MEFLQCSKCGWVHFKINKEKALANIKEFNDYYNSCSSLEKNNYLGMASIDQYQHCFKCHASYKLAVSANETDCPQGSTIQPLLDPND